MSTISLFFILSCYGKHMKLHPLGVQRVAQHERAEKLT
jgi:hypothetical protein